MQNLNQFFAQFIAWFKPIDAPMMIATVFLVQILKKPLKLKGSKVIVFAFVIGFIMAFLTIFRNEWLLIFWPILILDIVIEGIKYGICSILLKNICRGIRLIAEVITKGKE